MDEPFKIVIPDTQIQIGINKDEHPVYVDTKDIILSGDEKAELQNNREKAMLESADERMIAALIELFNKFVFDTIANICPDNVLSKGEAAVRAWVSEEDINWLLSESENQVTCIIRRGTKVLRTMPVKYRRPTKADDEEAHAVTA